VGLDINKLWTKKDSEQVEYFLQRFEQVLEEASDLRTQILQILNSRKTDYKHTIKATERISEATGNSWALLITLSINHPMFKLMKSHTQTQEKEFTY